jgi:ATP adenylyltransferase
MQGSSLHAPWRIEYIRSLDKPEGDECFLCKAAGELDERAARQRLVLWQTVHCIVLMNRFPYTNGHILVAPRAHKADLGELTAEESADLMAQTTEVTRLLRRAVSAQGFNIGINLGRCAGAGVPGHLHQHIVPRWAGDTNFMSVVGDIRIVPQAVSQLYSELLNARQSATAHPPG